MYEDDPQDTVFDVLGEAVFGDHPLGRPIIGRAPVIRDTPIDVIAEFHARRYVPGAVVIAAAGSVDHDAIVELAERTLGDARGARAGRRARARAGRAAARPCASCARTPSRSTSCSAASGCSAATTAASPRASWTRSSAGCRRSRLFQAVREERGLAYSRLLVRRPVRRHGPGRPLRRHAPGQPRRGDAGRRRRARAPARAARHRGGARARARERQGARRAGHGVHRRADAPARRLAAVRPAAAGDRRGHGAHRRRDDGRHALRWSTSCGRPGGLSAAGIGPDEDAFCAAVESVAGTVDSNAA